MTTLSLNSKPRGLKKITTIKSLFFYLRMKLNIFQSYHVELHFKSLFVCPQCVRILVRIFNSSFHKPAMKKDKMVVSSCSHFFKKKNYK